MNQDGRPLCKCHGKPMHKAGFSRGKRRWHCAIRKQRWNAKLNPLNNPLRIYAGETYLGRAATPEQAAQISAHVGSRMADFVQRQRDEYHDEFGKDS